MKRIHIILLALLVTVSGAMAQGQINRTAKTIVADVLAQLPADDQETYNAQLADLASTGQEGVLMLADMLEGNDPGSIVMADYALAGLAAYVSGQADATLKATTVRAYKAALARVKSPENKNFFTRQLRTLGEKVLVEGEDVQVAIVPVGMKTDNPTKELVNSLKRDNRIDRNRTLNLASAHADGKMYFEVIKMLRRAKPEVKIDILNWIGREAAASPAKRETIRTIEDKHGVPAYTMVMAERLSDDFEVKEAAVWAMTRIGDIKLMPVIAEMLASTDAQEIELAKNALAAFPGDINHTVAKVIQDASDAGKVAGLELLALRMADNQSAAVYRQMESGSPEVKNAAYSTLKNVVTEADFVRLCGMLETGGGENVAPLQEAIIASIASKPAAEKFETVNNRVLHAGTNKSLYYVILATTGEPKALQTILDGFNNGNPQEKEQAFNAILRWKGPETADALYNISVNPASTAYADRALTAYIKLVSNPALSGENRLIGLRKAMDAAKTDQQRNTILNQVRRTNTFTAMIYAGQFLDNKALQESAAQAVMNIALNNKDFTGKVVRDLLAKVSAVLNNPDAGYQREAINKHLNEMPQEEGYVSLFNGKDLTGWKGLVGNPLTRAKMTDAQMAKAQVKADEQMRSDWKVENGLLVFDGAGYDNLCTVKKYGDIEMYIDWMLDPSGKEADAGIYLRGTPQVQIWDTARVDVGAQVGSGGLYNNSIHPSKPTKVADNKMGEWNTFYIKMVGDRVTVVLNGEKVVDNVILENYWNRNLPIPAIEQLELQAHGSKVYYRDIYVKELPRTEAFELSADEKKEGYKVLFDGTNMHEWIGNTVDYTMDGGTISLVPSRGSGGNLYTKKEYGNFVFRFEFQLTPAANNGLGIRTPMEGDAAYVGMELQILDDDHPVYKDLEVYQYHGSVYGIIAAKRGALKPVGEWNYQEVVVNGDNVKVTLNGQVIVDGNLKEATKNGTADKKDHPGLTNKTGHIAFLGHGSPVKFRNIRIKELK